MNKNYYTTLYFIIAIGFSQRVTNKIYRALAKNKDLVFISILLNSYGIQFKESFQNLLQSIAFLKLFLIFTKYLYRFQQDQVKQPIVNFNESKTHRRFSFYINYALFRV
jgi:hypothetical protein